MNRRARLWAWPLAWLLLAAPLWAQSPGSRVDRMSSMSRLSGYPGMARPPVATTVVRRPNAAPQYRVVSRTRVNEAPPMHEHETYNPPHADEFFTGQPCDSCGGGCDRCGPDFGGCDSCGDCGMGCGLGLGLLGGGCGSCRPPCTRGCSLLENVVSVNAIDGFKGPLDLDGLNGNFGLRSGINGALPLVQQLGIGAQAGMNGIWSNLHGSQFTGAQVRTQTFVTVGVFQRTLDNRFNWGFGYDWLNDDYYTRFHFGQWRVKGGWQLNPCDEIGIWAAIASDGDSALLGVPASLNHFKPISHGNLYWQHEWATSVLTNVYGGWAEQPGLFVFGGSGQAPLNKFMALTANYTYMLPSASGGSPGYSEEAWNVSFGVAFYPAGSAFRAARSCFRPLLPVADNGSFLILRQ